MIAGSFCPCQLTELLVSRLFAPRLHKGTDFEREPSQAYCNFYPAFAETSNAMKCRQPETAARGFRFGEMVENFGTSFNTNLATLFYLTTVQIAQLSTFSIQPITNRRIHGWPALIALVRTPCGFGVRKNRSNGRGTLCCVAVKSTARFIDPVLLLRREKLAAGDEWLYGLNRYAVFR
jgi:hypothetical protein